MIYDHIFIADADIALRSVPEMRAQIVPRRVPCLPLDMWHCKGLPNRPYLCNYMLGETTLPVNRAPQFTLVQNTAVLFVSRRINLEATHIFCAENNFHYACMRSFPGATIDLLRNLPWPVPFSGMQLYFMKNLSLDYCNSHYDHWTEAAVSDIDNCMAQNITQISDACPSLKTFSLYIFSRPLLAPQFHGRLGTGQAALALSILWKRLDWLNLVSRLPVSAVAVFGQTIAPGAVWQTWPLSHSGLPKVTISKWNLRGVTSRWKTIRVSRLDGKKAIQNEEVENGNAASEDAEKGASRFDFDQRGNDETDWDIDETYRGSIFGSG